MIQSMIAKDIHIELFPKVNNKYNLPKSVRKQLHKANPHSSVSLFRPSQFVKASKLPSHKSLIDQNSKNAMQETQLLNHGDNQAIQEPSTEKQHLIP
jgi:hypothetical protein